MTHPIPVPRSPWPPGLDAWLDSLWQPLWGRLTASYLGGVVTEGVYEQALHLLGDPELHARLVEFLEHERGQAAGTLGHAREVGPGLPDTAVSAVRDLARLLGLAWSLRGTDAVLDQLLALDTRGERWYGALTEACTPGSIEAERYQRYQEQLGEHRDWLATYRAQRDQDGLVGQVEVVEFASTVPAPIKEVFAFHTDTRSLGVLWGVPVECPEGLTHLKEGDRFHLEVGRVPLRWRMDAHIAAMDAPFFFVDRKVELPFDRWEHHHHFTPLGPRETLVSDRLLVRPRWLPPTPDALQPSPLRLGLLLMLWWRHRQLQLAFSRA